MRMILPLCLLPFLVYSLSIYSDTHHIYNTRVRCHLHIDCKPIDSEADLTLSPISSLIRLAFVQHPYIDEHYLIDDTIKEVLIGELNKMMRSCFSSTIQIEEIQQSYINDQHSYKLYVEVIPMPNIYELNDR